MSVPGARRGVAMWLRGCNAEKSEAAHKPKCWYQLNPLMTKPPPIQFGIKQKSRVVSKLQIRTYPIAARNGQPATLTSPVKVWYATALLSLRSKRPSCFSTDIARA